jgi:hypothetical protein
VVAAWLASTMKLREGCTGRKRSELEVNTLLGSLFFVTGGGRIPTGWPHTAQSGKPDCRGPKAKPHQRDTPNTPIPGGAQCPFTPNDVVATPAPGLEPPPFQHARYGIDPYCTMTTPPYMSVLSPIVCPLFLLSLCVLCWCRHNGVYVQTKGLMEQDLMDTTLSYLTRREQDGAPFMVYYAPHAIHQYVPMHSTTAQHSMTLAVHILCRCRR